MQIIKSKNAGLFLQNLYENNFFSINSNEYQVLIFRNYYIV